MQCGGSSNRLALLSITDIQHRFEDQKMRALLSANLWTFLHAANEKDQKNMFAAVGGFRDVIEVVGTPPCEQVRFSVGKAIIAAGGVEKYRERVAALLKSKSESVRAFASVWLGVLGSKESIRALFELVRVRDMASQNAGLDRSRAAMALGLLNAKEHAADLAALLQCGNAYVKEGAALGLAYMKADEYAGIIAKQIRDREFASVAIAALADMGAKKYASSIAKLLDGRDIEPPTMEAAVYALAKLEATEYAADIACLLKDRYVRGPAAKSLALMKAEKYSAAIAEILKDADPLNRSAALLALGIMDAKAYEYHIYKHFTDADTSVRGYAAWSMIMIRGKRHIPEAIKLIDESRCVLSINGSEYIAQDKFLEVFGRAEKLLAEFRKAKS